jgi:hypothetical protein
MVTLYLMVYGLPVVCLVTLTMPFSEVRKYSVEPGATSQHVLMRNVKYAEKIHSLWTVPLGQLTLSDGLSPYASSGGTMRVIFSPAQAPSIPLSQPAITLQHSNRFRVQNTFFKEVLI